MRSIFLQDNGNSLRNWIDTFAVATLSVYTAVSRKVVLQKEKSLRDKVESFYR